MFRRKILIAGLLPLLALPLMGDSCTEDKVIFIAVGLDTTTGFVGSGELNTHDDTKTIDVKEDLDLGSSLNDNDINPQDVSSIKVSRVYYRVTKSELGREIQNGNVEITRIGDWGPIPLISGFTAVATTTTDWIEITNLLEAPAVNQLNDFLDELLVEIKGGAAATNTELTYHVNGHTEPAAIPTDFEWELKVSFLVSAEEDVEVPNF
jgi:hypothetical protein